MKFDRVHTASGKLLTADTPGALRVRYSLVNDHKKNTLLTYAGDDRIYFGISRCNLSAGDRFSKKIGKAIAASRVLFAQETSGGAYLCEPAEPFINGNKLWGYFPRSEAKALVDYFKRIDEIINYDRAQRYAEREKVE